MSKGEESRRYKWSDSSTKLLVSIWSHDMVQGRMKLTTRNQPIWESIARFMAGKGFNVTGLQCRTRIKNMLCNYYESVRKKDRSYIEPYFDIFQKIVNSRNQKGKGAKKGKPKGKPKEITNFEASESDLDTPPPPSPESSLDSDQSPNEQNFSNASPSYTNVDVSDHETRAPTPLPYTDISANVQSSIAKAIDNQTKILSEAVRSQTETLKRFMILERERFEATILVERENRKELEEKIDRIIKRVESGPGTKQLKKASFR